MDLGYLPMPGAPTLVEGPEVARLARRVEDAGAESLWAVEHVVVPGDYDSVYPYARDGRMGLPPECDLPDPLDWLTFAAASTERLRLGTAMLILPEHNPVVLAKRLATLDRLSGGRLIAGVGVGWLEEEYDAVGVPFARRGARADDALAAMRALWTQGPASHDGEFFSFADVHSNPRPTRAEGVPLLIGGHSKAAARRAGRYGDGLYPLGVSPDHLDELRAEMHAAAEEAGRDPSELRLTAAAPRTSEELRVLEELGVARVIMSTRADDIDRVGQRIERYRREVIGEAA